MPLDTIATIVGTVAPLFAAMWAFNQSINRRFDQERALTRAEYESLRAEIRQVDESLRGEIRQVDESLRAEIRQVDESLRGEIRHVDDRVFQLARDIAPQRQE